MNRFNKIIIYVICLLAFSCMGYLLSDISAPDTLVIENSGREYSSPQVDVNITGQVKNPGTYRVNIGMTYYDALCLAGGIKKGVDAAFIDLDQIISEPCTIDVVKYDKSAVPASKTQHISKASKLNINHATSEELIGLDGIGKTLAGRIIEYRRKNGGFKSAEDLLNIEGIGKAKFSQIKDYITVEGE